MGFHLHKEFRAAGIQFYLHKEIRAAGIEFYLHKEIRTAGIQFCLHKEIQCSLRINVLVVRKIIKNNWTIKQMSGLRARICAEIRNVWRSRLRSSSRRLTMLISYLEIDWWSMCKYEMDQESGNRIWQSPFRMWKSIIGQRPNAKNAVDGSRCSFRVWKII